MTDFRTMLSQNLAETAATPLPGESVAVQADDSTPGTPRAPAQALGESTPDLSVQPEAPPPVTPPAPDLPPGESAAVPQMRAVIDSLKQKLDARNDVIEEQQPFVSEITSRFGTPDEMRPFLGVVDGARETDPKLMAHKVGNALFEVLKPEGYQALVDNVIEEHADYLRAKLGITAPPAASAERVFEDEEEDDERPGPAPKPDPTVAVLQQQVEELSRVVQRYAGQEAQSTMDTRQRAYQQAILEPLNQVTEQLRAVPGGEEVARRVRNDVIAEFKQQPAHQEAYDRGATKAREGKPSHLFDRAEQPSTLKQVIAGLTKGALEYHTKALGGAVPAPVSVAAQAAAELAASTEIPRAASSAVTVTPPAPSATPTPAVRKSLKAELFDKVKIKADFQQMKQAGRF